MEIIVRKADLVKELSLVQGIVERKNSIPILSNVLAEARSGELRIAATDLDVSLRCGCAAQVVADGAITLGAKKLYEIARSLPESDVRLKVLPDSWASIECERVSFKMAGLPKEDFPALPEGKAAKGIEIPGEVLRDLIARTAFAITAEDARYYLAGALLVLDKDGAAMVATDGHRLSYAHRKARAQGDRGRARAHPAQGDPRDRAPARDGGRGHVPAGGEPPRVRGGRPHAGLEDDRRAVPRLREGHRAHRGQGGRPGARAPGHGHPAREPPLLRAQPRRAALLGPGKLDLAASSPDLGEARESLTADYQGATVEIGFNAQYLLDFLGVAGSESVSLELKDQESQGMFRPSGEGATDYRYVVMPMRL